MVINTILSLFLLISYGHTNANIPVTYLDNHSRYAFDMKDANDVHYMVYIYSIDEKQLPRGFGSWFNKNDQIFKGNYFAAVASPNSKIAVLQDCKLFVFGNKEFTEGTFNISDSFYKNKAYVIRSTYAGQPDILTVAQQATGGGDSNIRTFYIDESTLYLIYWQNNYRDEGDIFKFTNVSGVKIIENFDYMAFKTYSWANSLKYSGEVETIWKFDPSRRTMVFEKQNLLNKGGLNEAR